MSNNTSPERSLEEIVEVVQKQNPSIIGQKMYGLTEEKMRKVIQFAVKVSRERNRVKKERTPEQITKDVERMNALREKRQYKRFLKNKEKEQIEA